MELLGYVVCVGGFLVLLYLVASAVNKGQSDPFDQDDDPRTRGC